MRTSDAPSETILIGPGFEYGSQPRESASDPRSGEEQCQLVAGDSDQTEADEAARAARRVIIALLVGVLLVPLMLWGMVALKAEVTPTTAIVLLGLIAVGAVGGAAASDRASGRAKQVRQRDDEGRPVGCCPGPRPLRAFRDR